MPAAAQYLRPNARRAGAIGPPHEHPPAFMGSSVVNLAVADNEMASKAARSNREVEPAYR
jgi:hypothetical protein